MDYVDIIRYPFHFLIGGPSLNSNLGGSCPDALARIPGDRAVPGNDGLAIELDEVVGGEVRFPVRIDIRISDSSDQE